MNTRRLALASAFVLVGFATAQAKTLTSPPTYGGRSQSGGGFATCRLFNGGASSISVTRRQIITSGNTVLSLTSDTCAAGVGPGGYCAFGGSGAGNVAFSCRADVAGSGLNLVRAVMEVSNSSADILSALPAE
jgi:hypothetical protein